MKDIIKEIIVQNQERTILTTLKFRETNLSLELSKVQAIIGPRRVGKTSTMLLAMEKLRTEFNVPAHQIVYFNFEDERLQFKAEQLDLILQAWQELYPQSILSDAWFFFDEVQSAPGWERFLNRINETYTKKIFFTGSNSAILHTEIKSVLRGRSIAIELLPLSFKEFCDFNDVKPAAFGASKSITLGLFYKYLEEGGYPETINLPSQQIRIAYLQEYYNAMVLRDIIEYNKLSNYGYLRSLYRHAAGSIGKTISVRRLYNQLKSQQYAVGINRVYEAMDMAEQAYLFRRISKFDYAEQKRERSDKKIYWLDNGLLNANTMLYTGNKGLLLENLVFNELYRKFGNIYTSTIYYYAESTAECDFIIYEEGGTPLPIQACWAFDDFETRKREINGLLKACEYCKVKKGLIISAEHEEVLIINEVQITIKPAWKWILGFE